MDFVYTLIGWAFGVGMIIVVFIILPVKIYSIISPDNEPTKSIGEKKMPNSKAVQIDGPPQSATANTGKVEPKKTLQEYMRDNKVTIDEMPF